MAEAQTNLDQNALRDAFFTRVLHEYARVLYRVAFSVLRNPADAEDAVGDALLKLLRTGAWQTITQERAFLARTVFRCALDRLDARPSPSGNDEAAVGLLEDARPRPEEQAIRAGQHAILQNLIDQLPRELREPLLLSAVQELNSREIGQVLNLPEGTVRTRLMRARQQLRTWHQEAQNQNRGREVAARGPF